MADTDTQTRQIEGEFLVGNGLRYPVDDQISCVLPAQVPEQNIRREKKRPTIHLVLAGEPRRPPDRGS